MQVQCTCQRRFEVPVNTAGKRFRCPHCGHYITLPNTILAQIRKSSLISTGQPAVNSTIVVQPAEHEPAPRLLIWTAGVVAVTGLVAIALLVSTVGSGRATSLLPWDEHGNVTVNTHAGTSARDATPHTFGDPSRMRDPAPILGTEFYRQKSPIEMTDTEWIMTLQDWGELPDWWSSWPYSEAHPWSYPLRTQVSFFRDIREVDRTEPVSPTKLESLRKDFLSKQRDYEPYPANSPNNVVDRYLSAARTSLSRDLMQQQLDEAAKVLHSMLRPSFPVKAQAAPPPNASTTSE